MSVLSFLNLYPDAIEHVIEICESVLAEAKEFIGKYGTYNDSTNIDVNLSKEALTVLKKSIDVDNMTNSIISAYFTATENALARSETLKDWGISFSDYVNCHDSHLYVERDDSITEYHSDGDLAEVFKYVFIEKIHTAILVYLKYTDKMFDRKWVEDGFPHFDEADIMACLDEGKITGTIKEFIEQE